MFKLKCTVIKLLEAMCEETHPETQILVQNIYKTIDICVLQGALLYFHEDSINTRLCLKEPMMVGDSGYLG